jgi:glyoxylase I family protein
MVVPIAPRGFHHVALFAADVERVAAFYRDRLGLPELVRHHHPDGRLRSVWVGASASGEAAGGFFAVEALDGPPGRAGAGFGMVALRIDAGARHRVRAALAAGGLAIERETAFTLYVRDPEGNLVGLSHHPDQAPGEAPP